MKLIDPVTPCVAANPVVVSVVAVVVPVAVVVSVVPVVPVVPQLQAVVVGVVILINDLKLFWELVYIAG